MRACECSRQVLNHIGHAPLQDDKYAAKWNAIDFCDYGDVGEADYQDEDEFFEGGCEDEVRKRHRIVHILPHWAHQSLFCLVQ